MFAIARLTFWESSKKRVFFITFLLSAAFLSLYGLALRMLAQQMVTIIGPNSAQLIVKQILGQQVLGAGLYFASFLLALLALLASVGSIASEIENGLLQAIVSKPIQRREIVLGKFLGYGSLLVAYGIILFAGVISVNLIYNQAALISLTPGRMIFGTLIFIMQPLVLLSVAMVFSTLVKTLPAGITSVMLFGLGVIGGFLEQIGSMVSRTDLMNIGIGISLIMPADALFRKLMSVIATTETNPLASLAAGPFGTAAPPSNAMLFYTLLYILACLSFAIYHFNKKDL
ncbi:ABC transporter permease subunit [Heliobacillus mobilis]|uniref:ABC transporter permease subunit n=1 Tax=Heliobacterium mobile TaxID=28064 RepID=A0A6I3SIR0_HELMO|nr:ABC transporter permease subunit [Heliobacterium mobile]MTV48764.1 ABC transporter permease subunit [Heliobacterium mobile]